MPLIDKLLPYCFLTALSPVWLCAGHCLAAWVPYAIQVPRHQAGGTTAPASFTLLLNCLPCFGRWYKNTNHDQCAASGCCKVSKLFLQCFHDNWPKHTKSLLTEAFAGQEKSLCGLKKDVHPCSLRHKELCLQ